MEQFELSFPARARYFKLGDLTAATTDCWFVLHGQGQLAQYFIQKFKSLVSPKTCVIAPEGLSHYYLNGFNGRVGATWMTKENRLMDIENYITYLNTLHQHLRLPPDIKITILGFSQGAATASRWIMGGKIRCHRLILWGGVLPPDMNFEIGKHLLKAVEVISVNGNTDPFVTDEKFAEMRDIAERLNVHPREIRFEGGHDIDEATLLKLRDR